MLKHIEYMLENGYLGKDVVAIDDFAEIENKALTLRNLYLKCMVSGNKAIISKIIDGYKWFENKERELYQKIILPYRTIRIFQRGK